VKKLSVQEILPSKLASAVSDAPNSATEAAKQVTNLKMLRFCFVATGVALSVAFAVLFCASFAVMEFSVAIFALMYVGWFIGASSLWSIALLAPEDSSIHLATVKWKAFKLAETRISESATIDFEKKKALQAQFETIRSGCGPLGGKFTEFEAIFKHIADGERDVAEAHNDSTEHGYAEQRLSDHKAQLKDLINATLGAKVVYAIFCAQEALNKEGPNCREVVRWLLYASHLLNYWPCWNTKGDGPMTLGDLWGAGDASRVIVFALHDLGVEPDAAEKLPEPGVFDEVLRGIGGDRLAMGAMVSCSKIESGTSHFSGRCGYSRRQ
jgi:hypothetical protein